MLHATSLIEEPLNVAQYIFGDRYINPSVRSAQRKATWYQVLLDNRFRGPAMPPKSLEPSRSLRKQYALAEVEQITANSALGCDGTLGGNLFPRFGSVFCQLGLGLQGENIAATSDRVAVKLGCGIQVPISLQHTVSSSAEGILPLVR